MEALKPASGGKGGAPRPARRQGDSTRFPHGAAASPLPSACAPAEPRKQGPGKAGSPGREFPSSEENSRSVRSAADPAF